MSFIDKALERAKALRQQAAQTPPPAEVQPEPGKRPLPVVGGLGSLPPQEICYTVTRTVPVDFNHLVAQHLIVGDAYPQIAEEYKILRTHLLHRTRKQGQNALMITSPQPGSGKSLTAINLAISIAQEVEHTVLLVDADLREPSLHRVFGLKVNKGLVDFLKDGIPLPELLVHPEGIDKLVLLPGGRGTADAAELIRSPQMADLVRELKHCYPDRYVLFDLPPLLMYADAVAFAPLVDGIILVVEAGQTTREELAECLKLLHDFNLTGIVLNKVKKEASRSYYYNYYQKNVATKSWWRWFG